VVFIHPIAKGVNTPMRQESPEIDFVLPSAKELVPSSDSEGVDATPDATPGRFGREAIYIQC
jgi:hypothetical protein